MDGKCRVLLEMKKEDGNMGKNLRKWTAGIMAVTVLLSGCSSMQSGKVKVGKETYESLTNVKEPERIAYDDYEARLAQRENNPVSEEFVEAIQQFSWDSAASLLGEGTDNRNYSPLSLYYALALAAQGAEGKTEEEFLDVLGMKDKEVLAKECGSLFRRLYTDHEYARLKLADSLWLDQNYDLQSEFLNTAQDDFYASLFCVDFGKTETGTAMGQWIADQTEGVLAPELKTSDEDVLAIINTIYLYDAWSDQFVESFNSDKIFTTSSGEEIVCEYMHRDFDSHIFYQGDGYTGTRLPLQNIGSMMFFLPDEGIDIQDLLTKEKLKDMFGMGEGVNGCVRLWLPKFQFGDSMDLKPMLQNLGLQNAFENTADFSSMIDVSAKEDNGIFISQVIQETHVGIDEDGVEAAAYTEIMMTEGAAAEEQELYELNLNRPFLFGIISDTGVPMFLGVCNVPDQVKASEADDIAQKLKIPVRENECREVIFESTDQITPGGGTFHMTYAEDYEAFWYYDEFFTLEQYIDGDWRELPMLVGGLCGTTGYWQIDEAVSNDLELNWSILYGALEPGIYCVKKEVFPARSNAINDMLGQAMPEEKGYLEHTGPDTDAGVSVYAVFELKDSLGISLQVQDITSTGLTMEFVCDGGNPTGELLYGNSYWLLRLVDGRWCSVEYRDQDYEAVWTEEAYAITSEGSSQKVDWEWLYGELPPGQYRFYKDVMDFRETGDYDSYRYYADFEIE